jgi:hypothetical protein
MTYDNEQDGDGTPAIQGWHVLALANNALAYKSGHVH